MKKKYLIVIANYYKDISKGLLDSTLKLISKSSTIKIISVPGAFEIPVTISKNIQKYDAFIALGCIIKGDTPHFKLVSKQTFQDLAALALELCDYPLINGVLTVDNKVQAEERINPQKMNKGKEFIESLFQMMSS